MDIGFVLIAAAVVAFVVLGVLAMVRGTGLARRV